MASYLYGFTHGEQTRLIRQAGYWQRLGVFADLEFEPGESVLEIGCGSGGMLAAIHEQGPETSLAGIDLEPRQLTAAREHLARCGVGGVDLVEGSAFELPWAAHSFDTIWMSWFLEHLVDPRNVLEEAWRVLRPGGRVLALETDYSTFKVHPESPNYDYLEQAQYDYFDRHGCAHAGRLLAPWLRGAGFVDVENVPLGYHFYQVPGDDRLSEHAHYVADFIEPTIDRLAHTLERDVDLLQLGIEHLRSIGNDPRGAMTQIVYRAKARRPG